MHGMVPTSPSRDAVTNRVCFVDAAQREALSVARAATCIQAIMTFATIELRRIPF